MSGAVVAMVGAGTFEVRHPSCDTLTICNADQPLVSCSCGELTVDFNGGVPAVTLAPAAVA